jgi:hypothetical protein
MSKIDTGMGKVNLALQETANKGPNAGRALDDLFKDRSGGQLISGVNDLDEALKRTFKRDGAQQFNDFGEGFFNMATGIKGSSQILADQFDRLDQGLADLVSSGSADEAAANFDKIKTAAESQGISIEDLITKFPAYADALKQAEADAKAAGEGGDAAAAGIGKAGASSEESAAKVKEVADALADLGVDANGAATDLVKFTDALLNAGLMNLSARDAARNYQAAIDAVTDSVTNNGATLDINTEQGRANQSALDGIAGAGFALVKSNAANGESQKVLQGNLKQTYDDLVAAAGKFGITGTQAQNLARDIMKVPKGVNINSWMSAAAKKMAEDTLQAANNVDGKQVNVYVNTHATTFEKRVGLPSEMADGSYGQGLGVYAPKKAGGGDLDMAPGPKGVDSQLFFGAKGEHVLTANEVDKMGGQQAVYRFRAKVRSGEIQALAGGGTVGARAGHMFSPAAPSRMAIDYDRLAAMAGGGGDTYQFTVPDKLTAQDYFAEAQYQSRVRNRGGVRG